MAELIRGGIDALLAREAGTGRKASVLRAKAAVGQFASGLTDISVEHDRYLAESFGPE